MDNEELKNENTEPETAAETTETAAEETAAETTEAETTETETAETETAETETAETEAAEAETTETETAETETAEAVDEAFGGIELEKPEIAAEPETNAKSKNRMIAVGAAAVAVVAAVVVMFVCGVFKGQNDYNKDYMDVTGQTVGEYAEEYGLSYKEFLSFFRLPSDMPDDTNLNAALNTIPAGRYVEMAYNMDFDTVKEDLGWDESITEDMPWGEALDTTILRNYVGEEQFEEFKAAYGLGDEITLDSTWGDVRPVIEQVTKTQYEDQRKQQEEAEQATDIPEEESIDESSDEETSTEETSTEETSTEDTAGSRSAEG